jgi:hypothetical protein
LDDEINSDAEFDCPPHRMGKKTLRETHSVSEPKHKAAKNFRTKVAASVSGVGDFLKQKVEFDEKKFLRDEKRHDTLQGISQERLDLERRRENHLERESKVKEEAEDKHNRLSMATKVLEMQGAGDQLRSAAENYLLTLFN